MTTPNSLIETLIRHGIGYDTLTRFPDVFGNVANYPPHNIEKLDDHHYRLTLAVAGFVKDDISMNLHQGTLTIEGHRVQHEESPDYPKVLYRGIGLRDFSRQFKLGEHVHVINATLENGLLVIDMERRIPEELQPKQIAIN
jgi:molecular chaperone IbpA